MESTYTLEEKKVAEILLELNSKNNNKINKRKIIRKK